MSDAAEVLEKKNEKTGPVEFVKETREELEKVSYPSREDVGGTTIIVILNVIFFAAFLFLVDQGWAYLLTAFEWLVNKIAGV